MALIEWSKGYSVKVAQFDQEHQRLFKILNTLHSAMVEKKANEILGQILEELIQYTKTHFADEEAAMIRYGYPELERHRELHEALTAKVLDFQKEFKAGKNFLSASLMNFLNDWLVNHIKGADFRYSEFFNKNGLK